ncbi:MAG: hypothetical protein AAF682_08160 [Planctomycetota bacterium]
MSIASGLRPKPTLGAPNGMATVSVQDLVLIAQTAVNDCVSSVSTADGWEIRVDMQERLGAPDPDPDDPVLPRTFPEDRTTWLDASGELITHANTSFEYNDNPIGTIDLYIDGPLAPPPPQGCGCGCNEAGCKCGAPAPGNNVGDSGFWATTLSTGGCAIAGATAVETVVAGPAAWATTGSILAICGAVVYLFR